MCSYKTKMFIINCVQKLSIQQLALGKLLTKSYSTCNDAPVIRSVLNRGLNKCSGDLNLTFSCHYILSNHYRISARNFSVTKERLDDTVSKLQAQELALKYPQPKNVLHNYYNIVSTELNQPSYMVAPHYKTSVARKKNNNDSSWTCTYSLKWPEDKTIHCNARTKQEASYKAAIKALAWLSDQKKILDNGQPLLYDKEAVRELTRRNYYPLELTEGSCAKLGDISDMFKANLLPHLENVEYDTREMDSVRESEEMRSYGISQADGRYDKDELLSLYSAKELVELPIKNHREEFESLLDGNRVVIIRGEPGCGKSTRIPQYVLEHWVRNRGFDPVKIVVTQPRRIAAISLAERVAYERDESVGNVIGYHVRLRSAFNPQTSRILYCTTGILLRQLQTDASLSQCTHVILDEAHERDVNTDLLMNLLQYALTKNPNLKLIVMSATIDTGLFQRYFENAPVMDIPGFTYPVKVNFLEDIPMSLGRTKEICGHSSPMVVHEDVAKVIKWIDRKKPEGAILCFLPGWDEISKVRRLLEENLDRNSTLVLTLHSKLSDVDQKKIFNRPPPGVRKIILATNIAETSVTVDDVVYVVDTGIHKENRFDAERGIMCMDNHWISQSSMSQRKGRAGRVRPGESYHLYTKYKHAQMPKYSVPEILRVSLTKTVLDAKVYSRNMNAIEFFTHLPCPPEDSVVERAVDELTDLDLLDSNEQLTPLGRVLSDFQLPPKLAKAMVHSIIYKCVTPIVDIATIFSSETEMFSTALTDKQGIKAIKQRYIKDSDHISMMILFENWAQRYKGRDIDEAREFCDDNKLVSYKLNTLLRLQDVHYEYLEKYLKPVVELSDDLSDNTEIIKGVLLSGVDTVLMMRNWDMVKGRLKNKNVFITRSGQKATLTPESVNSKLKKYASPFLLYINETRSNIRRTTLVRETSMISPLTILLFKNGKLTIRESHTETDIPDPVVVEMDRFKFICSRQQAYAIQNTKNVLKSMQDYFIYQMTTGNENNQEVAQHWRDILSTLNEILAPKSR